ncbi:hypothetical protein [Primorskyibacter sp. S187A]
MVRSIKLSKYITVQGIFFRALPDGRILVRDGTRIFAGFPV